jgi:hypothetical protein
MWTLGELITSGVRQWLKNNLHALLLAAALMLVSFMEQPQAAETLTDENIAWVKFFSHC